MNKKGSKLTEEHRRKISQAVRGENHPLYGKKNPHSEATKRKISKTLTGSKHSEATKRKISKSMKGVPKSDEHRKNFSESLKGNINAIKLRRTNQNEE